MKQQKIWRIKEADSKKIQALMNLHNISEVMAKILVNRGLESSDDVCSFMCADWRIMQDPFLLPGMNEGSKIILEAIMSQKKILVYGDYDVDGITSTALMIRFLKKYGVSADYYIPDRFEEGYGINKGAVEKIKARGVELIITVDCGISSSVEVQYVKELGMDIVITDHHEIPAELPEAKAIINPKLSCEEQAWSHLAGVGVALKVAQAITKLAGKSDDYWLDLIYLAAIGTIADVVPLIGENRIIVKEGLKQIERKAAPGIQALIEISGIKNSPITTENIGYGLAPRLNACGRLQKADVGLKLLLSNDREESLQLAEILNEGNKLRQTIEREILDEVIEKLETQVDLVKDRVLVVCGDEWHAGVIGIVASRIVDKYYRPTIILSSEKGLAKGSARSIPGFHLYEALEQVEELLQKYGGHEMAAGLTVKEENIAQLRASLNAWAQEVLQEKDLIKVMNIDAEVEGIQLNEDIVHELSKLAPFGNANPMPVLAIRGMKVTNCMGVGSKGDHLKLKVFAKERCFDGIAFKMGTLKEEVTDWEKCDLAFVPEMNTWNGNTRLQLNIKDIKCHYEPDDPLREMNFLDRLYQEGDIWLEDNYYRDIVDQQEFNTKIVGVSFDNRQDTIKKLDAGEAVQLIREKNNAYDPYSIAVNSEKGQIGYLNARLAKNLAAALDNGINYEAYISQITGYDRDCYGVNICVRKIDYGRKKSSSDIKSGLQRLTEKDLAERIRFAVLGPYDYHEKQKEAVEALKRGKNSLVILGTGRGKSAIFQTMAAYLALLKKKVTIIIYPLRSLVNDQYRYLKEKMVSLGIEVAAVNGSMNAQEKQEVFKNMMQGKLDIILTTPEFLHYNIERFQLLTDNIGLFVTDEAHHLAQGKRKGYRLLNKNWDKLGKPLSLAVTATADDEAAQRIAHELEIDTYIIENHKRSNLMLIDKREEKDKLAYLISLVHSDERIVAYVNSRKQSYQLASDLRLYCPKYKDLIGYYHGGLNGESRKTLEEMFQNGSLKVMITTSAFGEGINIPDIKHVVLYHLCFSSTEFNQLSGRAGRNNEEAFIHILFGDRDKKLNELILESVTPSREVLAKFYIYLRDMAQKENPFQITNSDMAEELQKMGLKNFREQSATTCLGILEELGLLLREVEGSKRFIHMVPPPPGKLDLTDSVRYLEGWGEWEEFQEFAEAVLKNKEDEILEAVNRPIFPKCLA